MMKGKGIIFAAILTIGMIFTSCEELDNMFDEFGVKVNSDYYEIELAIPPVSQAGIEVYIHTLMQSDIDEIVEGYGDASATVQRVEVTEAYIEVMDRSGVPNLNAVEAVTTTIATESLSEQTIASVVNTTEDATVLPMTIEEIDISKYVEEEEYKLTNYGELRKATTDTLWVRGRIRYQISLNISTVEE